MATACLIWSDPGSALWIALSSTSPSEGPAWTTFPQRPPLPQVVINEVLASNNRYRFADTEQETPDAIELFNGSETDVFLGDWSVRRTQSLESGSEEIREFKIPGGTMIPSQQRLVLYCSKKGASRFHTGFKLPSSGAMVELIDGSGSTVDRVE